MLTIKNANNKIVNNNILCGNKINKIVIWNTTKIIQNHHFIKSSPPPTFQLDGDSY